MPVICQMVFVRYVLRASAIWQHEFVAFSLIGATFKGLVGPAGFEPATTPYERDLAVTHRTSALTGMAPKFRFLNSLA